MINIDLNTSHNADARFHAVVADFGLATSIPSRSATSTPTGNKCLAVVGSAWWMAPECIELAIKAKHPRSKEYGYNECADVFSFGIIVCQICARIEADPEYLQRTANYGVDYMALSKLVEDDPKARHLMLLAMDCTKYQPEERPTFAQIADRLSRSRAHGPGVHLVDKRIRTRQVWRKPATSPLAAVSTTQSKTSNSQLPQVWVHTVIRTIDPDFRPARNNPFAALEDRFRDGRKVGRFEYSVIALFGFCKHCSMLR